MIPSPTLRRSIGRCSTQTKPAMTTTMTTTTTTTMTAWCSRRCCFRPRSNGCSSPALVVLLLQLLVTNLLVVECFAGMTTTSTTTVSSPSPISGLGGGKQLPPPFGPIDEAMVTCNMEELEQANDLQLYSILHDLKQTLFFRMFRVDLSHKCPLVSWRPGGAGSSQQQNDAEDERENGDGREQQQEEGEEFDCPSSNNEQLGLDVDDEPLCTVQPEEENPFPGGEEEEMGTPGFLASNALFSLSREGFESREQRKTYTWKKHSAKVVSAESADTPPSSSSSLDTKLKKDAVQDDCDVSTNQAHLPEDFWLDLCTRVGSDDPSVVNLLLNPERNTGYNGTHIWKAIYEENCYAVSPPAATIDDVCLEERVMYRLISGLHASTTLSIAKHYFPPSKRKGRIDWESNPSFFMQKFSDHPDHVRNLHFSYVVLLRALTKASQFLHSYEIRTGNVVEDETATVLLKRLLDSSILRSCSSVFYAFDESLMFASASTNQDFSLQHNFKDVFFNVSSILDCVQCQQCKLHGKMAMLGYGTALKILFSSPNQDFNKLLTRNEVVALINTLAKFSESIRHVRELTHSFLTSQEQQYTKTTTTSSTTTKTTVTTSTKPQEKVDTPPKLTAPSTSPVESTFPSVVSSAATVDAAVGLIASLARQGLINSAREMELIRLALARHVDLLILTRHYAADATKFLELTQFISSGGSASATSPMLAPDATPPPPDAIVIGSGLAGMTAALNILDRGGRVVMLEKEHLLGGNSNKASSGINACCPDDDFSRAENDSMELFRNDTVRSAGTAAREQLINVLVNNSAQAVAWLRDRVGVDLSLKAQLGGHSAKRTHRPSNGMAGAEIIYGVQKAVKAHLASGRVSILTDSKVTRLLESDGRVVGVAFVDLTAAANESSSEQELYADNVILATGGFAADRSPGSFLEHYRPELLKMPTTAGDFSTGDGITLATALGAGRVDMDKVQVHPTGWVDPANPTKTTKILAAELMRGIGGILINAQGDRFCNELGTRSYVTDQMLSHNSEYAKTKQWDIAAEIPTFSLILSSSAAADGKKHVDLYTHKGLLVKLQGVNALSEWMKLPKAKVVATLRKYQQAAQSSSDEFGKTTFRGVPLEDLESEVFYAGTVIPVLHYCMGGITIDSQGNVLDQHGNAIAGLHAAGEVTGGVHGVNRLAGNSLLECTVYGTVVGQKIPIRSTQSGTTSQQQHQDSTSTSSTTKVRTVFPSELAKHNTPEDCWVAIHGVVYDLTSFAEEHPAGPESIHVLAGKDGSEAFAAVHNAGILEEVFEDIIGNLSLEEDGHTTNPMMATGKTSDNSTASRSQQASKSIA